MLRLAILVVLAIIFGTACSEPPPNEPFSESQRVGSPNARPEVVSEFKEDSAAERHASDGQGRAWIQSGGDATVSTPGTWEIVFEAGSLGIAAGGAVYLQVSPFWGWDMPQTKQAGGPGFTTVSCATEGVDFLTQSSSGQPLRVEFSGRGLRAGEQVIFVYGAGPMGARADLYAESASRFWVGVDGDGDGIRGLLVDSPTVRVNPGPAARLVLTLTSTADVGKPIKLTVAVLDKYANAGPEFVGTVRLVDCDSELGFPQTIQFSSTDAGRQTLRSSCNTAGVYRVTAEVELEGKTIIAESNPLEVASESRSIYWADLHGHSSYSDGTGTPEDYLDYARNVAALDIIALTDHDHYGFLFLDSHEDRWEHITQVTADYHEPHEFVALLGFEWTNWIYGHRHVLYFEDHGDVHSSLSEEADTPQELWSLLRGKPALTITHHSAGSPVANDWSIAPDPTLEPVAEVMSVHGSSEAEDSPMRLRGFMPDNSVRSALDRGYKLGFVGSGDSHDGHPGLPHLSPSYGFRPTTARRSGRVGTGGLAAIQAKDLTRESVLNAIRERRVYATSGPRILLDVHLTDHSQGSSVASTSLPAAPLLNISVVGTAPIARVDLIKSGAVVSSIEGTGTSDFATQVELSALTEGDYVYVRVIQSDKGMAWSSPIFIE